ncbi:MAG: adenine phosphoribosyltransferase, partial [Acidimicrobiia bacterium]
MDSIRALIREIPDYPKPGILFYDITPVLGDGPAFRELLDRMVEPHQDQGITKVAGIEARGFTLAAPIARMLGAGFIPVRKPGKLPHKTKARKYDLEYGSDALEVHIDAASEGDRILIVDDLLATGGTAAAAVGLFDEMGGHVVGLSVFIELTFLKGRDRLGDLP